MRFPPSRFQLEVSLYFYLICDFSHLHSTGRCRSPPAARRRHGRVVLQLAPGASPASPVSFFSRRGRQVGMLTPLDGGCRWLACSRPPMHSGCRCLPQVLASLCQARAHACAAPHFPIYRVSRLRTIHPLRSVPSRAVDQYITTGNRCADIFLHVNKGKVDSSTSWCHCYFVCTEHSTSGC